MPPKQALAAGSLKVGTGKTATIFASSIWSDDIKTYNMDQQKADKLQLLEDGETVIGHELRLRGLEALQDRSRTIKVNSIVKHELARRTMTEHPAMTSIETSDSTALETKATTKAKTKARSASLLPSRLCSPTDAPATTVTPAKAKAKVKSTSPTPRTPSTPEPDLEAKKSNLATKEKRSPTKVNKKTVAALAVRPVKQASLIPSPSPPPADKAKGKGKELVKFDVKVKVEKSAMAKKTPNIAATHLTTKEGSPRRSARIASRLEGEKK